MNKKFKSIAALTITSLICGILIYIVFKLTN